MTDTMSEPPRRRRRLVALALLLGTLVWVGYLTWRYAETRKPLDELSGIPAVQFIAKQRMPSFVLGLYGTPDRPLAAPLGVASSPRGDRIYVTASAGTRATFVFDRDGVIVGTLVPPDTVPGGRMPAYVAVDPANGTVYVSDRLRAVIDRYSGSGEYLGRFAPAEPPVAPLAIAFDRAGALYVTDTASGQHRVLVYDTTGALVLRFGREGDAEGEFSYPNGVAVDASGAIYVADSNNGRVQIFGPDGAFRDSIGRGSNGTLGMPRGVFVDDLRRLFVVDTTSQSVEVWDVSGKPRRLFAMGSQGAGDGQFAYPNGVTVDRTSRVYITDRVNDRVQVWSY